MSHTSILDKIWRHFVNLADWISPLSSSESISQYVGVPWSATPVRVSCNKNCQERDFDRQCFVNIAIQVIAQLFETPDALQDFGCAESACQCSGFFSRTRKTTLRH